MNIPIDRNNNDPGPVPVIVLTGQGELKEMLASVIGVLCEADLVEEIRAFCDRVLISASGGYKRILDYDQVGENEFVCRYKPMVELVLIEIKAAAMASGWTVKMRKERIAEILDMAGF